MSKSSRRSNVNAREPMAQSSTAQLRSYHVGALPIINHFLEKLDLHNILESHLPRESGRVRIERAATVLVLVRNLLLSREPVYGIGEWAARQARLDRSGAQRSRPAQR